MQDIIRDLLIKIGEDPDREGLKKTPERFENSIAFLTQGYRQDPREVLRSAIFHERYDEMVTVKDIHIFSMCEHHMLPFFGKCHVAYMPRKNIVGLSKIARVVELYARRLQVQERLTQEIATALMDPLQPADARFGGVAGVLSPATGPPRSSSLRSPPRFPGRSPRGKAVRTWPASRSASTSRGRLLRRPYRSVPAQ